MPRWMTLLLLLPNMLHAAAAVAQEPFKHALIIGVSVYQDAEVPVLPGVPKDMDSAKAIAVAMGIPADNVTELFNEQATKKRIIAELRKLAGLASESGRILVYFSGHGTRWRDPAVKGCVEGLLTWDRKVIVNREFAQYAKPIGSKADKLVIMFDACHSGGIAGLHGDTRSLGDEKEVLRPKFFMKADDAGMACERPSNVLTRSLLGQHDDGVDALPENVVHITSSRRDEISFDGLGGGLATQGVKSCLLGTAKDLDGSGAVTLSEVEQCAQDFITMKLAPFPNFLPQHVSVTGMRNLIPVAASGKPTQSVAPTAEAARLEREQLQREQAASAEQHAEQIRQEQEQLASAAEAAAAEAARRESERLGQAEQEHNQREQAVLRAEQERLTQLAQAAQATAAVTPDSVAPPPISAVASLQNIYDQRDTRRTVAITVPRKSLHIGADSFEMTLTSKRDGYVYVLLLGSDQTSFYLLFPNGLDNVNMIKANRPMQLPRPNWEVKAGGPPGIDHVLVLVTDTPRDLSVLGSNPANPAEPYTSKAAGAAGRRELINFFVGDGVRGSPRFAAALLKVEEVP
jgi:hypothetical protein